MADNKFTAPDALARCEPMSRLQSVIGGKWKILILWYVAAYGVQRFNELQRRLAGASHTTLTRQLRELEEDGFLCRTVYGEVPPRVEYRLSPLGESFAPLLHAMLRWSEDHLEELGGCAPQNTDENEDI